MAAFAAIVASALLLVRCAGPDQCIRMSDCGNGFVCFEGTCKSANGEVAAPVDSGTTKPASDATADSAKPATEGGAATDAQTAVDSGADTGSTEEEEETDF